MKTTLILLIALTILVIDASAQVSGRFGGGLHRRVRTGEKAVSYTEPYPPTIYGLEFIEGTGTTYASSFGPSATATATLFWITGASGSGFGMRTGSDEHIDTDSAVTIGTSVITVCVWLNCVNWSTSPGVIVQTTGYLGTANGFRLYMTGDGNTLSAGMTGDTASFESMWSIGDQLLANTWQHVAFVLDGSVGSGGALTFYYNGVATAIGQSTSARDGTSNFADAILYIGSNEGLDIQMDDLRVYSGALSAGQINAIYLNPR